NEQHIEVQRIADDMQHRFAGTVCQKELEVVEPAEWGTEDAFDDVEILESHHKAAHRDVVEDDKEEQPWHGHQVEHPVFAHLKQETVLPVCRGGGRGVFGLWQKGQLLSFAGCGAWPGTGRPGWRIASLCLHDTADTGRVSSQNT